MLRHSYAKYPLLLAVSTVASLAEPPKATHTSQGVAIAVDATRSLGRFGPLWYGAGIRGALDADGVREFAESGGDFLRLLPPEGGWERIGREKLAECAQAVRAAGILSVISLGAPGKSLEQYAEILRQITGPDLPSEVLLELPEGSLEAGPGWLVDAGIAQPTRVRTRLLQGAVPQASWPEFVVLDPSDREPGRQNDLMRALVARAESTAVLPVVLCAPPVPVDSVLAFFEGYCRLSQANPTGIAPTLATLPDGHPQMRCLEALIDLLSQSCRLREVRVSVSTPDDISALAGRYAGGTTAVAANTTARPLKVTWSYRAHRGIYLPRVFVMSDDGTRVSDRELPAIIANVDGSTLTLKATIPAKHLCGIRLANHPYSAYRAMGDLQSQVQQLTLQGALSAEDGKLLFNPLADARKSINNLLAPKPLTPAKVQRWSHQSLLRLAQVELAFRNLAETGRLGPVAAGALAGQINDAMEHLSSASSAGFRILLEKNVLPPTDPARPERRVKVWAKNRGSTAVSRVRLEVTSEAPVAIEPVRSTSGGRLLPGQSVGAEFLLRPRGSVGRAECHATLSYSASRSYARRSLSFEVEWPASDTKAGD